MASILLASIFMAQVHLNMMAYGMTDIADKIQDFLVYLKYEKQYSSATLKNYKSLVAFLSSERSSYITGQSIAVDGGVSSTYLKSDNRKNEFS